LVASGLKGLTGAAEICGPMTRQMNRQRQEQQRSREITPALSSVRAV
jgi:hypothetical protein